MINKIIRQKEKINIGKLKVLSLFSGIGAFEKALSNLNIPYELIGFSEIDKYAIEAYSAIHNVDKSLNLGDVSKINNADDINNFDLMTFGFPCQDISIAGQQQGFSEDSATRSSLLWEAMRIAEAKRPKYMIAENVKNLIGKKFKEDFDKWLEQLDKLGYNTYYEVLNAKNFGIPQNRERVFVISIRKDIDDGKFKFPIGEDLKIKLKDILEDEIEGKYYLSEKVQQRFKFRDTHHENIIGSTAPEFRTIGQRDIVYKQEGVMGALVATDYKQPKQVIEVVGDLNIKGQDSIKRVYSAEGISPTLTTMQGGNRQPKVIESDEKSKNEQQLELRGDGITNTDTTTQKDSIVVDLTGRELPTVCEQRTDEGLRFFKDNVSGTLRTISAGGDKRVIERDFKIRKLTPLECWRLMGFSDEDFRVAKQSLVDEFYNGKDRADSQLYKQAGNSIVVNVLEGIFKNLFT